MKILFAVCVALTAFVTRGLTSPPTLASLPEPWSAQYKAALYIEAAAELQQAGRDPACQIMLQAVRSQPGSQQVIVLCKMLFTQRHTSEFRPPLLGAPIYPGGTDSPDWPQTPIEFVDGAPFLITQGYDLAGVPEPAEEYLRYCMANCDWNSVQYRRLSNKQMHAALTKLLASAKWKRPLKPSERKFLSAQID